MKKNDAMLIAHLRSNCRAPLTSLSRKTGLPVSTIHDKMRLYSKGVVSKNTALLSFREMGFSTDAYVFLKVDKAKKEDLMRKLSISPNVNSLFKVNNGWDVMFECVFRDMCALEEFVESLEANYGVVGKEVHYVLDELRRECFMSDPNLAESVI